MVFNHYLKIKSILEQQPAGWYIKIIHKPTTTKKFNGELRKYDYYYRIYNYENEPIKYCKLQQLDRLAKTLQIPIQDLPVIE